jgi:hypothetical protein
MACVSSSGVSWAGASASSTLPLAPCRPAPPTQRNYGGDHVTLVPGRLRGYRSWRLNWPTGYSPVPRVLRYQNRRPVYLGALTAPQWWRPGDQPAAECVRELLVQDGIYALPPEASSAEHPLDQPIPAKDCSCGYYAQHSSSYVADDMESITCVCATCRVRGAVVGGVVEGWGRVEVGKLGWRAARARIVALHVPYPRPVKKRIRKLNKPQHLTWVRVSTGTEVSETSDCDFDEEVVEVMCPAAESTYHQLRYALAAEYQVPIYWSWADLVTDYPPTDLAALRRSERFGRVDGPTAGPDSGPGGAPAA